MMMMMASTTNDEREEEQEAVNWKLYDNPFFQNNPSSSSQSHFHKHLVRKYSASAKHIHRLHRDLKFDYPPSKMNSELDQARAQIAQLKEELEFERKMRKKAESLNKMMARELVDQRREREQMCDNLTKEVTHLKAELEKTRRESEAERKMLKMAEVLREERLQMKLSDAKLFYQEKCLQLTQKSHKPQKSPFITACSSSCSTSSSSSNSASMAAVGQPKRSNDVENPHIKRGIKGFVEFPRMVKAINGSANGVSHGSKCRDMGITKLECQKAQLKILLKQKSSLSSNNLVIS